MVEDPKFNAFIKDKLEEGIKIPAIGVTRRNHPGWRRPIPIAAAAALICVFSLLWRQVSLRETMREQRASDVLELLEQCQYSAEPLSTCTFAERLLAWQDAPFDEIQTSDK